MAEQVTLAPQKSRNGRIVLIAALAVGVFAALAYAALMWRQQEMNDLNQRNAALQKQVQSLKSSGAPAASPAPSTAPAATVAPSSFTYTSEKGVALQVYLPQAGAKLVSPLAVVGQIPSGWSFEAQFPVELQNAAGTAIAHGTAHTQSDWTAPGPVPFTANFDFNLPAGTTAGFIVLGKDNPSGQAAGDDTVKIPVTF